MFGPIKFGCSGPSWLKEENCVDSGSPGVPLGFSPGQAGHWMVFLVRSWEHVRHFEWRFYLLSYLLAKLLGILSFLNTTGSTRYLFREILYKKNPYFSTVQYSCSQDVTIWMSSEQNLPPCLHTTDSSSLTNPKSRGTVGLVQPQRAEFWLINFIK